VAPDQETFEVPQAGGTVIIHMMKEKWIEQALKRRSMIGTDGMPYHPKAPLVRGKLRPGLGRYVRANSGAHGGPRQDVADARPAPRGHGAGDAQGHIQVGCDADISLRPETVIDTARSRGSRVEGHSARR
jgi:hypothetical protein